MQDALYGEHGFYRRAAVPAQHFRTSAHISPLWAGAIAELATRSGGDTVVEVGAGGGELIGALADLLPSHRLVAVELAPRPAGLPARVEWHAEAPDRIEGLLLANEWLDNVAVDVAELTAEGPHYVEVTHDGRERIGSAVDESDAAWLKCWWPLAEEGDRAEIGRTRDEAWSDVVRRLRRGVAVAIDYAADPRRDVAGTLTGYRDGQQVMPVPDGSCDITAHVLMESLTAATDAPGSRITSQRDALAALGVQARRPAYTNDSATYLAGLQAVGEAAELLDRDGLGGFAWLVQARGVALPIDV